MAHGCLGTLYLAQGELEHAIWVLDLGLALCRVFGNRSWFRAIAASLGYASALQGRLAEGHALPEEAISESTRTGNVYGRGALTQAAWAATCTKHTYLAAPCRRLTTRLGQRRARVAVGHRMLVMAWHVLSQHASDQELGSDYFDRCDAQAYRLKLLRKLEALGLKVAVEPATSIAAASSSFS